MFIILQLPCIVSFFLIFLSIRFFERSDPGSYFKKNRNFPFGSFPFLYIRQVMSLLCFIHLILYYPFLFRELASLIESGSFSVNTYSSIFANSVNSKYGNPQSNNSLQISSGNSMNCDFIRLYKF